VTGDGEREAVVVREGEEEDMAEEGRGREGEEGGEVQEINDYGEAQLVDILFPSRFRFRLHNSLRKTNRSKEAPHHCPRPAPPFSLPRLSLPIPVLLQYACLLPRIKH